MIGHTKGRAAVEMVQEFPFGVRVVVGDVEVLKQNAVAFATSQRTRHDNELAIGFPAGERERIAKFISEQDANAALIAEAFNVADETGRTPAQLAAERAELVAELTNLLEVVTNKTCHGNGAAAKKARAILAKVKGPVQS